eukprot:s3783_g9.t1
MLYSLLFTGLIFLSLSNAAAGLDVHLHPWVLITISEHVVRFRTARRLVRVLGVLLGIQETRRVDVPNSFELEAEAFLVPGEAEGLELSSLAPAQVRKSQGNLGSLEDENKVLQRRTKEHKKKTETFEREVNGIEAEHNNHLKDHEDHNSIGKMKRKRRNLRSSNERTLKTLPFKSRRSSNCRRAKKTLLGSTRGCSSSEAALTRQYAFDTFVHCALRVELLALQASELIKQVDNELNKSQCKATRWQYASLLVIPCSEPHPQGEEDASGLNSREKKFWAELWAQLKPPAQVAADAASALEVAEGEKDAVCPGTAREREMADLMSCPRNCGIQEKEQKLQQQQEERQKEKQDKAPILLSTLHLVSSGHPSRETLLGSTSECCSYSCCEAACCEAACPQSQAGQAVQAVLGGDGKAVEEQWQEEKRFAFFFPIPPLCPTVSGVPHVLCC